MDAIGCQTAISGQIRAQEGDDLLALKSNHKKAYKAIKQHFHPHIEHQLAWRTAENFFDAFDDSHGRTVRRRVWVITDSAQFIRVCSSSQPFESDGNLHFV